MTRPFIPLAPLPALLAGCGGSASSSSSSKPVDPHASETSPPGDIPDNQAYVAYSPPGADYSVKVPEGWGRTAKGGAVTFTDKLNSITMKEGAAKGVLSVAAARRTDLAPLKTTVRGFRPGSVSLVKRTSGPAVRITYLASGRPDAGAGQGRCGDRQGEDRRRRALPIRAQGQAGHAHPVRAQGRRQRRSVATGH